MPFIFYALSSEKNDVSIKLAQVHIICFPCCTSFFHATKNKPFGGIRQGDLPSGTNPTNQTCNLVGQGIESYGYKEQWYSVLGD